MIGVAAWLGSGLPGMLVLPRPPESLSRREIAALAAMFTIACTVLGPFALPVQLCCWFVCDRPRFWWRRP